MTFSASQTSFTCADIGDVDVILTVTDSFDFTMDTCSVTITVEDATAPTPDVTALSNVRAQCSVTSLTAPTAADNCGGMVIVTNNASLPITAQGTTVVPWSYAYAHGQTSRQPQISTVNDSTKPIAIC